MKKFKVWMKTGAVAHDVAIDADRYQLRPNTSTVEFITGDTSGPTVVAVFFTNDIYGFADVTAVDNPAAVVDPETGRVYEHLQLRRDQAVDEVRSLKRGICDAKEATTHAIDGWLDYLETHNQGAFNHLVNADREDLRAKIADALTAKKV